MSNSATSGITPRSTINPSALVQFVLSVLTAVLLIGVAIVIVLVSIFQFFAPGSSKPDPTQSFMVAASIAFGGVLVLPSAWYSWKSIVNPSVLPEMRKERRGFGFILTGIVLVLVIGALLLGNWVSQHGFLTWLLLPPLNIIATGLPALWLVYLGTRGLPMGPHKRFWGVFAVGVVLGPLIIIILELLALIVIGVLVILYVSLNPSLSIQLTNLITSLRNSPTSADTVLRLMLPFLLKPGILFIGFTFISIIVPLIEESLKPLGIWFLVGQKIKPMHGFVYGVLSGAGFGLFENLGNTSNGTLDWALLASSRISTLLLHCFTAGLVGWALVSAWSQKRYLRLALSYLLTVLIHGLWNGMAVLSAVSSLQGLTSVSIPAGLQRIGTVSAYGIIILGGLVLVLFISFNALLRNSLARNEPIPPQARGEAQPPANVISPLTGQLNATPGIANSSAPENHSQQNPTSPSETNL